MLPWPGSISHGTHWPRGNFGLQFNQVLTSSHTTEFCFDFAFNVLHRLAEGPMVDN